MKINNLKFNTGFGLVGIMATIGTLIVLFTVVAPALSKFKERQVVNTATEDIISTINEARSQTLASVESSAYGIRFNGDEIIIFKGQNYSDSSPDNRIISLLSPALITEVYLDGVSGSVGDFYFERLSGKPSKSGSVTLTVNNIVKVINITATGAIYAN